MNTETLSTHKISKAKMISQFIAFLQRINLINSELENSLNKHEIDSTLSLKHMHLDSRLIQKNDVFVAIQGAQQHGLDYLGDVLQRQAALILCDRELTDKEKTTIKQQTQQPLVIVIPKLANILGNIASWFYDFPSKDIKVVAITGTNGKTSSAFFTAQLLAAMQQKVAVIGTLGNGPLADLQSTTNTTPDAISVQRLLKSFVEQGMQWCIMEVSSHALSLGRVQGVEFESVAMTQITRDHIDFHGTEKAYKEAKKRLFTDYKSKHKIINVADKTGLDLYKELVAVESTQAFNNALVAYSATTKKPEINQTKSPTHHSLFLKAQQVGFSEQGIACNYKVNDEKTEFKAPLMGAFNIENCFCALSILLASSFKLQKVNHALAALESVQGRMQLVHQQPTVIIDFAHTPDALEQVLQAVKTHLTSAKSKLTVVFGCGGDRDKGKRPLMGKVAERLADRVVLTSDNPRSEEPLDIIIEILKGVSSADKIIVIEDREIAITSALDLTNLEDIVVIAGKGHEAYQEVKGVKHAFSDALVVDSWAQHQNLKNHV